MVEAGAASPRYLQEELDLEPGLLASLGEEEPDITTTDRFWRRHGPRRPQHR